MNRQKLDTILPLWRRAHQLKHDAQTDREGGMSQNWIKSLKPKLQDAWCSGPDAPRSAEDNAAEETDSFRNFDYYMVPASPAMLAVVDTAWSLWCQSEARFSRHIIPSDKQLLAVTLANIVNAELSDANIEGVAISRMQSPYTQSSLYRPSIFNLRFLTVIDGLVRCGLIEQVIGQAWHQPTKPDHKRRKTLISSSTKLQDLLMTYTVTDIHDTAWDRTGQEIIRRKTSKTGQLDEYDRFDITANGYRLEVREINEHLAKANLTVLNAEGQTPRLDDRRRFLQRQFTYGSWTSGGRFIGGFWMPLTKQARKQHVLINGEACLELDYNAIGLRALYAEAGAPVPSDLYTVPGLESESRKGIKALTLARTFCKLKQVPKEILENFSAHDRALKSRHILGLIEAYHAPICHLLTEGKGHSLQFKESQVLTRVLLEVGRRGLTGLPIHDCLLVPVSERDEVKEIMERVALEMIGAPVPVKEQ